MAQQFIAHLGPFGRLKLPAALLPWKPGTRLYWTCRVNPVVKVKAVIASPDPLGSLLRGRYCSSRVKVVGTYSYRAVHQRSSTFGERELSKEAMRLERRLSMHRARVQRRMQ